jgi:hypothetical protein
VELGHRVTSCRKLDDGSYAVGFERKPFGSSNIRDVDQGVLFTPPGVTDAIEFAVVAVITRFGSRPFDLVAIQQFGQLTTQSTPVRSKLLDPE